MLVIISFKTTSSLPRKLLVDNLPPPVILVTDLSTVWVLNYSSGSDVVKTWPRTTLLMTDSIEFLFLFYSLIFIPTRAVSSQRTWYFFDNSTRSSRFSVFSIFSFAAMQKRRSPSSIFSNYLLSF